MNFGKELFKKEFIYRVYDYKGHEIYLPEYYLKRFNIEPEEILNRQKTEVVIAAMIERLALKMAIATTTTLN